MVGILTTAVGAVSGFLKSPVGQKVKSKVGGFFKKILHKKSTVPAVQTVQPGIVAGDWKEKTAEQVNDWLGTATKDSREITTSIDQKTLLIGGAILLGAVLLLRK